LLSTVKNGWLAVTTGGGAANKAASQAYFLAHTFANLRWQFVPRLVLLGRVLARPSLGKALDKNSTEFIRF
jgi:hypothetical protein